MPRQFSDEKPAMADEHTPLIAVVQTRPARDRYPHHTLRYICTLILTSTLFLGLAAVILILNLSKTTEDDNTETAKDWSVYVPFAHGVPASWPKSTGLEYSELQDILTITPDAEKAREWSQYYTAGPHLAGKNLSQAIWTKEKWQEFGIENSLIVDYDLYINYPKGHRLALLEKDNKSARDDAAEVDNVDSWKIAFEASLEEDVLEEDGTSGLKDRIPTFHGYSASGNVTAPYVFVNYGTYKDFKELVAANISLAGKIALVKYGGIFRGLKVKRAQELGMVGVVMYSDPGDDGEVTEANGNATYPDGPARAPSSVQRGSCQFLSMYTKSHLLQLLTM
jgi:N-acetylated-alpha-linked acidic dipeptidase